MKRNNKKGFTIVELVIVIAVIGILAGVLIPTFSGIIDSANKSADLQEARNGYNSYLVKHPEAKIDYVKNGSNYYDLNNNFTASTTAPESGKVVLDVDNWYIAGVCADTDTTPDGKCNACGATIPAASNDD